MPGGSPVRAQVAGGVRFRRYLVRESILTEEEIGHLDEECAGEVMASFKRNEVVDKPGLESMFEDVWAEMPDMLREQSDYLVSIEGGQVREDTSGAAFPL